MTGKVVSRKKASSPERRLSVAKTKTKEVLRKLTLFRENKKLKAEIGTDMIGDSQKEKRKLLKEISKKLKHRERSGLHPDTL